MRALQKLVRNGNSTQVSIPRATLQWLEWLPGEAVIIETLEDKSIRIRRPAADEFLPKRPARMVFDASLPLSK
jgi:antitoxin component of MazEF toxin-antitoxin module